MPLFIAMMVFAVVGGGVVAARRGFDRLLDARVHGTPEQELRHSEQVTGSVIQSGSGGFNGR